MSKLPAIQFYPGDWMKDPQVRACSLAARGLWMDMICLMHESPRRGYLQHNNGSPVTSEQIARMTGCHPDQVSDLLRELETVGVFSRSGDAIYCRRMVRDEELRKARAAGGEAGAEHGPKGAEHGAKGGRPPNKPVEGGLETPLKTPLPVAIEPPLKPPPSVSSSVSVSIASSENQNAAHSPPTGQEPRSAVNSKTLSGDWIRWSAAAGWEGITERDRAAWAVAYPAVSLDRACAAAGEWLLANPTKAVKRNWRRFLTGWLTRSQERGGDTQSNRPKPPDHRAEKRAREYAEPDNAVDLIRRLVPRNT